MSKSSESAQILSCPLESHHRKELFEKRGLNQEWCEVNCHSITAKQATEKLGYTAYSDGIWLEGANREGQFKPDKPWKHGQGEKRCPKGADAKASSPKYRSPLGEYDVMLPIHPQNKDYWHDLEALKQACYIVDGHPCLVLTEGFFKAIALCSHGIPAIALLGVEMGLTPGSADPQGKRYVVPSLERFARAGFGFIHAFDADCATNKAVIEAQHKLAHQLTKFNIPQYIATGLWSIDEGKGVDDYIQMNGVDKFKSEVLGKVVNLETWKKQFAQSHEKKATTQSSLTMEIAEKYRDKLAWSVQNQAWYYYESEKKGVWAEVPHEVIGEIVFNEAQSKIGLTFNHDLIAGIIRCLKYQLKVINWQTTPGFICLEDCVIESATLKELPHDPGYRFLSSLPYKWSDRTLGCDVIQQWLWELCEGRNEWIQVLRGAMKATVTERGGELQRFMELVGFGGTGKGTVIRLVTALIGKENITVTDLKQLERNRFETATIYGKKAVIISDSERYAGDVSVLKALTGNDEIRHEKKGVQQTGGFRFKGMVWIAANEAIQSADYTSGLKRRRLSMPFDRVIPPHLRRNLETEFKPFLSGLLAWVLSMPDEEMFDYVRNTDTKVRSLASFNAEILLETNPIALWADSCLVLDHQVKTYIGNKSMDIQQFLFANYCSWVELAGYNPVSQARFSRNLLDLLKSQLGITEANKGRDNRGAYITGISIRQPGLDNLPRLITFDQTNSQSPVTANCSDGSVTGCVMGSVTGQSIGSDGFFESDGNNSKLNQITNCELRTANCELELTGQTIGSDGFFQSDGNNSQLNQITNCTSAPSVEIKNDENNRGQFSPEPSNPSNPSPTHISPVTQPVTHDGSTHHHVKPELMIAVGQYANYGGEKVQIVGWEQAGSKVQIEFSSGRSIMVKRGSLKPWSENIE